MQSVADVIRKERRRTDPPKKWINTPTLGYYEAEAP